MSAAFFYCLSAITVRKEEIMEGFSMAFRKPDEIADAAIEAGMKKVQLPLPAACIGVFRRRIYRAWVLA